MIATSSPDARRMIGSSSPGPADVPGQSDSAREAPAPPAIPTGRDWTPKEKWMWDAAARICAGSGLPITKPGHLFGTCAVCRQSMIVHDGPPLFTTWRHREPVSPGLRVSR